MVQFPTSICYIYWILSRSPIDQMAGFVCWWQLPVSTQVALMWKSTALSSMAARCVLRKWSDCYDTNY